MIRWRAERFTLILVVGVLMCLGALPAGAAAPAVTTRVSVGIGGAEPNGDCKQASLSADGRFVAFTSDSSNLVTGDTNASRDVFVYDRDSGTTTRASVRTGGGQGDSFSGSPSISANGRYVAFSSDANSIYEKTWGPNAWIYDPEYATNAQVFVHDMQTGVTTRESQDSDHLPFVLGGGNPSISGDGQYVAFESARVGVVVNDAWQSEIYLRDRNTGLNLRISKGPSGELADNHSYNPKVSADGRFVVFDSLASNLVAGDTNGTSDVFVYECATRVITRASVSSSGIQGDSLSQDPSISADGRYVAFTSNASNLAPDDPYCTDVFVRDRLTGQTTCVSHGSFGERGSTLSNNASISGDGRYVCYYSGADDLVGADTNYAGDLFVRDMLTGVSTRVNLTSAGGQSQAGIDVYWAQSAISGDGSTVAFSTKTSDLVAGDTNGKADIFVSAVTSGAAVRTPVAPAKMSPKKSYTVYAYLKPRHTAGTHPVRIYKYRWVSRKWKSFGFVTTTAANYSTYSKCSVKLKLTTKGNWRLRAYTVADANHVATWSNGYDYVTVK